MKKTACLIIFFIYLILPVYAKNEGDSTPLSFKDLGRYIETLEINDEEQIKQEKKDNEFEEQAILDITKRYENNAVELKLEEVNDEALELINSGRIFDLKVNETQIKIENDIKNENMIWDSSKNFAHSYFNSTRHLAPIPGVVNSSKISAQVSPALSAQLGQAYLYDANGPSVLFVRANESTYNTGSVISYKGSALNLSAGSFSSSYNHASSGGAILSTNELYLPKNTGSLVFGAAYIGNEEQEAEKATGGGFVEYSYKRFKLNAQVGQSRYSNSSNMHTSLYLIPEFKISETLYLKTRFIRNVTEETMQDELALTFRPKRSNNNLEFEINTSNHYTNDTNIKQRIKFSTSFKI